MRTINEVSKAEANPSQPSAADDDNDEAIAGALPYLTTLAEIHRALAPDYYLEIGVRHGHSLALASCPAVGIDPEPEIRVPLAADARVFSLRSDDYFETYPGGPWQQPPDLVFIDGMHLFEYALRDFIHVERMASATTLVVIDDIYPNHPRQTLRDRQTRVWTGDVWRLHDLLRAKRPDLYLLALDTEPTGLLLVAGLDAESRVLADDHYAVSGAAALTHPLSVPAAVLRRDGAIAPRSGRVEGLLSLLRDLRPLKPSVAEVKAAISARYPS